MDRLERELQQGLRGVTAPPELWDRVQAAQGSSLNTPALCGDSVERSYSAEGRYNALAPSGRPNPILVWALAASVGFIALGLASIYRESVVGDEAMALRALADDSHNVAFHCQNPSQLRAWVRANTGINLPLRAEPATSIQLIGAQTFDGTRGVRVAYRAGDRDAVLLVSRVNSGAANVPHNRASGNISSWVMDGQRYTLACTDPAELQLACKLCHLD
jgi:hypothetical protein